MQGILYLIPTPLYEGEIIPLPQNDLAIVQKLDCFIVERAKTARKFLKQYKTAIHFDEMEMMELDKHSPDANIKEMLQPVINGKNIGLMSEAGCPGVADPGANVVAMAHQLGIKVVPLIGPSSILMALMASGMNGQSFAFQGYLPIDKSERKSKLMQLEQLAIRQQQTQIMIETPYRNIAFFEDLLTHLQPSTRLCVASNVNSPDEWILTKNINEWKKSKKPEIDKVPTVFLFCS
jgi:16S rRNA (cytidine1402-2'-O)-methyltransferase